MSFRGIISFLTTVLLSVGISSAQDTSLLDTLCRNMSASCVEMTYSFSTRVSGVINRGNGTLRAQDHMWEMSGNGAQMYCDARSVWIIDPFMKEVVIEPLPEEEKTQLLSNPAVIFSRLKELFRVTESLPSKDGKSVMFALKPLKDSDVDYCNVEIFHSGKSIRSAVLAMTDGTLIKIEVSSMKLTPKLSVEAFRPQEEFDLSWIVTDLR